MRQNQMRKASRPAKFTVVVSLVMAVFAFVLGSAPFTPALVLAIISLPLAIGCSFFGVWRLSAIAVYWAIAAFLAIPMSRNLGIREDFSLVILGVVGLALSAFLYVGYMRTRLAS